jgi:hypothetical protein
MLRLGVSDKDRPDPDGTEMIDLGDADVSAVDVPPSSRTSSAPTRSAPPPLPPEVRASAPPPGYASMPPPPPRSGRFYALLIVGFVAVGVIVGLAVAFGTRGEKKTVIVTTSASPPAAAATGSVMTLPTIDMNDDDGDGGK